MLFTALQRQPRTYGAFSRSAVQVQTDKETKRAMTPEAGGGEEGGAGGPRALNELPGKTVWNTIHEQTRGTIKHWKLFAETVVKDGALTL